MEKATFHEYATQWPLVTLKQGTAGGHQMKQPAQKEIVERYFRHVGLVSALRDSHGIKGLSRQQEELLEFIGQAWQDDKPLSVRKLMAVSTMASTVTIHRWLKVIIAQGFVEHVLDPTDSRKRLLKPTKLANDYFSAKAKAITKALK
jgi:DNA-binding MarR family transcriptional regulator